MSSFFSKLIRPEVAMQIMTLTSAKGLSNFLSAVSILIFTRFFSPENYGLLTIFTIMAAFGASFATLKLESAIVAASTEKEAGSILSVVMISCAAVGLLSACIAVFYLTVFTKEQNFKVIFLSGLIGLQIFLTGSNIGVRHYLHRAEQISSIAKYDLGGVFCSILVIFLIGIIGGYKDVALIIGVCVNHFVFNLMFLMKVPARTWTACDPANMKAQLQTLRNYPLYLIPSSLVSLLASQLHFLLLNAFVGKSVVGHLGVYTRVTGLAHRVIGQPVGSILRNKMAAQWRSGRVNRSAVLKTVGGLFAIGAAPTGLLMTWGPELFEFFLGTQWGIAGEYAKILAPSFLFAFVVSPVSSLLLVTDKQKEVFVVQGFFLLLVTFGYSFLYFTGKFSVDLVLKTYVVSYVLKSTLELWFVFKKSVNAV